MSEKRLIPSFGDILGQERLIGRLKEYVAEGTIPHALLFMGEEGSEALPLALAFARYIQCEAPEGGDACGRCLSCRQLDGLAHPDLFALFPVTKRDGNDRPVSADRLSEFREMLERETRPTFSDWKESLKSENRQPQMYISEAEALQHALSYKSFGAAYRVVVVWLPELMNTACANTLLKLIEEPPEGVVFLMVSSNPSAIIPTIYSRLQRIKVAPVPEKSIAHYLTQHYGVGATSAIDLAHLSQGNLHRAIHLPQENAGGYYTKFAEACRILYLPVKGDPRQMREAAEEMHKMQRSEAIELLDIMLDVMREVNVYNLGEPAIRYLRTEDMDAVRQLANFQSLRMLPEMMEQIMTARAELSQNAMAKIVIFDLLLSFSVLLRRK